MNAMLKNVKVSHVMIIMIKMIASIIKEAYINPKNQIMIKYKNSKLITLLDLFKYYRKSEKI